MEATATQPLTFDDLLASEPELRKLRMISADRLRRKLGRQKGECTWCGGGVPKGRRTWCSDKCVTEYNYHCVPGVQKAAVTRRDKGICQLCGIDTVAAYQAYREQRHAKSIELYGEDCIPSAYRWKERYCSIWREWLVRFGFGRGHFSEVDHIVPVSEGGGLCGLDNLRLICGRCHAAETKKLAARNGLKRRKGQQ